MGVPLYNFKELDRSLSPPERLQSTAEPQKGPNPSSKQDRELLNLIKDDKKPKQAAKNERSQSNGARLQELCPEDKAKIGELVKKLALETKQKEEYAVKFEVEKAEMSRKLTELESLSSRYENERERMRGKLKESVKLLKELKDQKESAETVKYRQEQELARVREELARREREVERVKAEQEALLRAQEEAARLAKQAPQESTILETKRSSSVLGLQDFLQGSPENGTASSTLKEIAELKNEIIKLTSSLRQIKAPSPDKHPPLEASAAKPK